MCRHSLFLVSGGLWVVLAPVAARGTLRPLRNVPREETAGTPCQLLQLVAVDTALPLCMLVGRPISLQHHHRRAPLARGDYASPYPRLRQCPLSYPGRSMRLNQHVVHVSKGVCMGRSQLESPLHEVVADW